MKVAPRPQVAVQLSSEQQIRIQVKRIFFITQQKNFKLCSAVATIVNPSEHPRAAAKRKGSGSAMHPKRVEQLAARIRENQRASVNSRNAITHIEAAHTKLVQLQTARQQMKAELAHCIDERDNALREVKLLRVELRKYKTPDMV